MAETAFVPKIPSLEILNRLAARTCIFWQFNPDYLGNIAYSMHTLADEDHEGEISTSVARRNIEEFLSLTAPMDTPDGIYLHKVRAELVSYSNDILRHKREFKTDMLEAIEDARVNEDQYRTGRVSIILAMSLMKLLPLIGISTLTGLFTFMLKGAISEDVASSTGVWAPTFFVGVATFVVGKIIGDRLRVRRESRIRARLAIEKSDAWHTYAQARLQKTRMHLLKLHEIWFEYTGIPYWVPIEESHTSLIEDEIRLGRELERKIAEFERPWLTLAKKMFSKVWGRVKKKGGPIELPQFIETRPTSVAPAE